MNGIVLGPADLTQALFDVNPHIVHFSGHGVLAGSICLEDRTGESRPVSPESLESVFDLFSDRISCVVLNACYSKLQAEAIVRKIRYVVGMEEAVNDSAAISFSVGFYRALANGRTVEDAFRFGSAEIGLSGYGDPSIPRLLVNPHMQKRLIVAQSRQERVGQTTYASVPSIPGRATIGIGRNDHLYAMIDPTAYPNIGELLDDLFIELLSDKFEPYSYGEAWILSDRGSLGKNFVTPLEWVTNGPCCISELSSGWYGSDPQEVGIIPGSKWYAGKFDNKSKYYGVASNDSLLVDTLCSEAKAIYRLRSKLKPVTVEEVNAARYRFKRVFRDWLDLGLSGKILIERKPESPSRELT